MAVSESVVGNNCKVVLNNGTDSSGNVKTVSVGLGALSGNPGAWDATKAMAIVSLLGACLSKTVYDVQHTTVTRITD